MQYRTNNSINKNAISNNLNHAICRYKLQDKIKKPAARLGRRAMSIH